MLTNVTPQRVRQAYIDRGWTPRQRTYGNETMKAGCALGVLLCPKDQDAQFALSWADIACRLGLKKQEIIDFTAGFDEDDEPQYFSEAYNLGKRCWEHVKDLALPEDLWTN